MRSSTSSIQNKVFGVIFGLTFSLVAFLATYFPARQIESVRHGLETRALSYATLLSKETESAVAFDDRETAREVFAALSEDPDVRAIALYKSDGQVLHALGELSPNGIGPGAQGTAPRLVPATGAITAVAPVVSKEGPRGTLLLEMSTESIDVESARIGRTAAAVGLGALVAAALAAFWIGRSLARRLGTIARATHAVAAGNLDVSPISDDSGDEVGQLARSCNRMLENLRGLVLQIRETAEKEQVRLDDLVRLRTQELDARNQDMRLVLDHVSQGLLTVDCAGTISPEHSRVVEEWLGAPRPHATLWEYLAGASRSVAEWLELGWSDLGDGPLPLAVSLDQLPKKLCVGKRDLALAYTPILEGDRLQKVLVVVSDVTSEIARQRAEAEQRETLNVFERVAKDRAGFVEFVTDAKQLIARIVESKQEGARCLRDVHTLKGNCAMFGLTRVAAVCHEIEGRMVGGGGAPTAAELDALVQRWEEVSSRITSFLAEPRGDRLEVAERDRVAHVQAILSGTPRQELARAVARWKLESASDRLARLALQVEATAQRLGKSVVVTTEGNDLRFDGARWRSFWGAFTHVIRNAVDHGVASDDQQSSASPAPGNITLRTAREGDEWVISIADDGPGIDWEAVAERGRALGLPTTTHAELVDILFRDGVSTRTTATEVSGRGVGLGAVRAECEARGGKVLLASTLGVGTTFFFRFPASTMYDAADVARARISVAPRQDVSAAS